MMARQLQGRVDSLSAELKESEAQVERLQSQLQSMRAEREELWRSIFIELMDDAPWAPVFNEQRFTMRAARLGGSLRIEHHEGTRVILEVQPL